MSDLDPILKSIADLDPEACFAETGGLNWLTKTFSESEHPRADDGQWSSGTIAAERAAKKKKQDAFSRDLSKRARANVKARNEAAAKSKADDKAKADATADEIYHPSGEDFGPSPHIHYGDLVRTEDGKVGIMHGSDDGLSSKRRKVTDKSGNATYHDVGNLTLLRRNGAESSVKSALGWLTKSTDASGHEHAADGRFGTVAGSHNAPKEGASGGAEKKTPAGTPQKKSSPTAAFSEGVTAAIDAAEAGDLDPWKAEEQIGEHAEEFTEKIGERLEKWSDGEMEILVGQFTQTLIDHPDCNAAWQDFESERESLQKELIESAEAVRSAMEAYASSEDEEDLEAVRESVEAFDKLKAETPAALTKIRDDYAKQLTAEMGNLSADADSFADDLNSTDYEGKLDEAKAEADAKNEELEDDGNPFRLTYDEESDEWSTYIPVDGEDEVTKAWRVGRLKVGWITKAIAAEV